MSAFDAGYMLGVMPMKDAVEVHLQGNFFPPISKKFVPAVLEAIQFCYNEEFDYEIELPNGRILKAIDIIEETKTWEFVEYLISREE